MKLNIDTDRCVGCGLCENVCIRNNISTKPTTHEIDNGACFDCGHCMAICPTGAITLKVYEDQKNRVEKYDAESVPVKSDDLLQLYKQRRSIRWFKNELIDKETFDALFEACYYSPSAQNKQETEFVVINERLDEFIDLVYDIIKVQEDEFPRIKQLGEYLEDKTKFKNHPLLWEGKQLILAFSENQSDSDIAMTRLELLAYAMGLGGFYSLFIKKADEINHEKLMKFFSNIDAKKHMNSVFIIGYPRKKFRRTIPHKEIKVTYD